MLLAALVDTEALWKIAAVAFGVGVGGVTAWSLVIVGASRFEAARAQGATLSALGHAALAALAALVCAAAIVVGLIAMTHK